MEPGVYCLFSALSPTQQNPWDITSAKLCLYCLDGCVTVPLMCWVLYRKLISKQDSSPHSLKLCSGLSRFQRVCARSVKWLS